MKRLILSLCFLAVGGALLAQGQLPPEIIFQAGKVNDPTESSGGHPRTPINPPSASLDGHTLYMEGEHPGYMLSLVDSASGEADVVYQVYVPASTGVIVLPVTLTGTFELQLYGGGAYYFYAEITL